MAGILIAAHCNLAQELLSAAEMIVGKMKNVEALSIDTEEEVGKIRKGIQTALKRVNDGTGVLILTDMFGGTPSNMSLSFLEDEKVEVVTGANLPMLIKIGTMTEKLSLKELASMIRDYGRKNINLATEILNRKFD
jgi:PTS system mannose-specific IIA component